MGRGGNGEGWKEHKLAREGEPGRKARSINEYEMTNHIIHVKNILTTKISGFTAEHNLLHTSYISQQQEKVFVAKLNIILVLVCSPSASQCLHLPSQFMEVSLPACNHAC